MYKSNKEQEKKKIMKKKQQQQRQNLYDNSLLTADKLNNWTDKKSDSITHWTDHIIELNPF